MEVEYLEMTLYCKLIMPDMIQKYAQDLLKSLHIYHDGQTNGNLFGNYWNRKKNRIGTHQMKVDKI